MSAKKTAEKEVWTLPPSSIQALASHGTVKAYPKNTLIVSEGDRGDTLFVILAGKVKVYLADEEGKEVMLNNFGTGEYFGEIMLDAGPRSANVMTVEPSKFALVSRDQFKQFLADNVEASFELINSLIQRVRALTKTVGNLALLDVYGRVARMLLELATDHDGKMVITERPTQQEMANRVGCSREMISRILKDLRAGGYVREEGHSLIIARKPPRAW